jgi:hypothetical protein
LLSLLRRRDDELRTKIKYHLLALGWTIASKPNLPGLTPRLRYVSLAGSMHACIAIHKHIYMVLN